MLRVSAAKVLKKVYRNGSLDGDDGIAPFTDYRGATTVQLLKSEELPSTLTRFINSFFARSSTLVAFVISLPPLAGDVTPAAGYQSTPFKSRCLLIVSSASWNMWVSGVFWRFVPLSDWGFSRGPHSVTACTSSISLFPMQWPLTLSSIKVLFKHHQLLIVCLRVQPELRASQLRVERAIALWCDHILVWYADIQHHSTPVIRLNYSASEPTPRPPLSRVI